MPDQETILLQTKLHRPRLPNDLVARVRLIDRLDHEIDRPLILVCAPAGFGKTTLIVNWLERMQAGQGEQPGRLPSAWLSLDESDSDLTVFLRYFIAALRTVFNEACGETLALLQARQQPPLEVIHATLSNELARLPGESILVLDDYHIIHSVEVHNLLGELVRHWPRPLHLVLISRISPPIPLDSLRAKGLISEFRTRDLRFTPEETAAYLSQSQTPLSQNALPVLEERFEGWPAGLHLAALSLRSEGSQESILQALSSENANITGYLVGEVLTHQLPAIHSFLLKTSILDRFCASLCETVAGDVDTAWSAGACLDWIERSELFITPLDNRRTWYRYHHLFQQLLKQRLSAEMVPDQVTDLHLRASAWFNEQGLLDEALHHALAAGDIELAARLMGTGLREAINREDRPTLERWLRLVPEEVIQQHPELLMIRAWALQFSWRLNAQAQIVEQVDQLLDSKVGASLPAQDLQILRGQVHLIRAEQAYFGNQATRAINHCRHVLALMPPTWTFVRGGGMLFLGMSMQATGQALPAERLLLEEYESYSDKTDTYALFLLQALCFNFLFTGRLEQARQTAQVLLGGSTRGGLTPMRNWADWFLGVESYLRNELDAAAQHFTQIVENRYTAQISAYRDAVAGLAQITQVRGDSSQAWKMVESISQFDIEQRGSEDNRTRSLRARLMLQQGDLEGARQWAKAFTDAPPDQPLMWLEEPQVTRARILSASAAESDQQSALQVLDALKEIAGRTCNSRYMIEILAMRALALDALGESSEADAELARAVELARLGGFLRAFTDLGRPMQAMLRRLADQGHSLKTVRGILQAYGREDSSPVGTGGPGQPGRQASPGASPLAEPLTPREFEVLSLLRGPLSTKEIALNLNISYATTKRHIINIYGKLGVGQRWKAVAKAEELNLLPPR